MDERHRNWITTLLLQTSIQCARLYGHARMLQAWWNSEAYFSFRKTSGVHSLDLNLANPTEGKHDSFDDALRMIVNVYLDTSLRCRAQAFVDFASRIWMDLREKAGVKTCRTMSHLKLRTIIHMCVYIYIYIYVCRFQYAKCLVLHSHSQYRMILELIQTFTQQLWSQDILVQVRKKLPSNRLFVHPV